MITSHLPSAPGCLTLLPVPICLPMARPLRLCLPAVWAALRLRPPRLRRSCPATPDIVISEYEDVEKEDALQEQLGVPVITLKAGPGGVFDDNFFGTMRMLGQIFRNEEKAEKLCSFIESERAEISRRTADIPEEEKPAVYICGLGNWGTTNHLMTAQNYISFNVANVRNVVTDLEAPGIQAIEEEKFVALGEDMDIIIMDAAAVKNIKPLYAEDPTMFDTCKAWRSGEVYLEMAYNAYYTNYEIALINTWFIAKSVYPEQFADIDMTAKTNEVTQVFYGMDLAEKKSHLHPPASAAISRSTLRPSLDKP